MFSQSHGIRITPLGIYNLGGGHTHTHTHTHKHIPTISTESILINQVQSGIQPACAWGKNMSVIVIIQINVLCNANLLKLIIRFEVCMIFSQ